MSQFYCSFLSLAAIFSLIQAGTALNCSVCGSTSYGSAAFSNCSSFHCVAPNSSRTAFCYRSTFVQVATGLAYSTAGCDLNYSLCSTSGVSLSSAVSCCNTSHCNSKPQALVCSQCGSTSSGPISYFSCVSSVTCAATNQNKPFCYKYTNAFGSFTSVTSGCDVTNTYCSVTGVPEIPGVACCNTNFCNSAAKFISSKLLALLALFAYSIINIKFLFLV